MNCSRCSCDAAAAFPTRRRWACSLNQKTAKKPAVNTTPVIVATSFVSRLAMATTARTRKISVMPSGMSNRPRRKLNGTSYSRCSGRLNRRMSIESDMKTKLQMTPKA